MRHPVALIALLATCLAPAWNGYAADPTLLLRQPTVSDDHLAFTYAGDIWIAARDGAEPRRLTVHGGLERDPHLSPDGRWVAFSGEYDGNVDVYVVPVEGGQPVRLTFHPYPDSVRGWAPDGSAVLFRSTRLGTHHHRSGRLFTVPVDGGWPEPLPMPHAERGSLSPDGGKVAYTPFRDAFSTWKRYRGGRTVPVWVFDLATHETFEVPHDNASDSFPVWLDGSIYFLSDRAGTMNVFAAEIGGAVRQVTHHGDMDVRSLAAGGGVLVYEQAGRLHEIDPAGGEARTLDITIAPDLPATRPHLEDGVPLIRSMALSTTGKRALFEARGEIFSVPAEHGDVRNLTRTPGVAERAPEWEPDGTRVAYLSDASGEYQLQIGGQDGQTEPEVIPLGDATFYHAPQWSPDGDKLLYTDKRLNLWWMDLTHRRPLRVDTDTYDHPPRTLDPVWSPDGRWIAYTKMLPNHLRAVFVYDTSNGQRHRLTDGMSDCIDASFSPDGQYLYFAASTNVGQRAGWLDMSSYEREVRRDLYVVVLGGETASPLAPRSDEEEGAVDEEEGKKKGKGKGKGKGKDDEEDEEEVVVEIDFEGLDQRILGLPVDEGELFDLRAAGTGKLFYLEQRDGDDGFTLHRYDMEERESVEFLSGVRAFTASADGAKLLVALQGDSYKIVEADADPDGAAKADPLDLSGVKVWVDPRAEWDQMYTEAWRIFRDYFYDPDMHGIDWPAVGEAYRPWIAHVGHRDDLNYVLGEMMGELVAGHSYRWGGDYPDVDSLNVGLLGADLAVEDGRYRITRILAGNNWEPYMRAPLTEPGVDVSEGDYLLAIDGVPLEAPDSPLRLLQGKANQQVVLRVGDRADGKGARDVTVVPAASEVGLRHRAWVEGNRARVDEATGGRVAYVYVPNTAWAGYTSFNRYYYAQLDKQAVILDERYNGGGSVADYMVDVLGREILNYNATREGADYPSPLAVIPGPKVMLINQDAGSGGDCLPHYFRLMGLGTLVGTRTWGGLIGIYDYPHLIDGGVVTAPRIAFFGDDGNWTAENVGVAPDIEVPMTPSDVIAGRDPQLEEGIRLILEQLEADPPQPPERPPYPDYSE